MHVSERKNKRKGGGGKKGGVIEKPKQILKRNPLA